ncbi:MAG: NAD(P)H-hydrate dehydratase, partial [Deltaproteobacteria bacterium]|nr:NAD(P)H-hydrate dehydratase [Deltaproteobacteria bacterium]
TGAAIMTAESALRGGCGLVTLACPQSIYPIVASQLIEVMGKPLDDLHGEVSMLALDDINKLLQSKDALALGPGLGLGEETGTLVRRLIQDCPVPAVIDADGLTHLTGHCEILKRRQGPPLVLTPHPGEMSRLTGMTIDEIQANRVDTAREFASTYGVVLVLKGSRTITACPSGKIYVNLSGHVGLASGGMGDVLTGLIGSFLAQGLEPALASALATYIHGRAADNLRVEYGVSGLLATDIMQELPLAREALHQGVFNA